MSGSNNHHPIRVYGIPLSHPVLAVRGMLERKGLPYRYVELLGGAIPRACGRSAFATRRCPR